jgi:dCTP deaminase
LPKEVTMTFLCKRRIRERASEIFSKELKEKDSRLQPCSYELSLGNEVFLSSEKKLIQLGDKTLDVMVKPGDFAILLTHERVCIPKDLMGMISIKTTYKNMGLVNISGFHVDPGFEGKLTFSVYNAGPGGIILRYKDPIFIIFFAVLSEPVSEGDQYGGEHNNQENISSKDMNKLTGKPISLLELETRINKYEIMANIQWGLLAALTIALIVKIFSS